MEPVTTIQGHVTVLDRADVDTDQIIPKQFLKRIERTGYGEFLFFDWVRSGEVSIEPGAVLVAGRNFGCGSSREHAVWAIQQFGFDAVIAPYHDVGMTAIKVAAFGSAVNVTLGLPFPRTSPDHGTALDIAGRGIADPGSMIEAMRQAIEMAPRPTS